MYHNIDKSGFRPKEYVGYAHGAWRIYQIHRNEWRCLPQANVRADLADKYSYGFTGSSLREISARLESLNV